MITNNRCLANRTARHTSALRQTSPVLKVLFRIFLVTAALLVLGVLVWQGIAAFGDPNPEAHHPGSAVGILDIGVLVFREGLECVLVLSAITASMTKSGESYQRPVAAGVAAGFLATLVTWFIAVCIVDDLTKSMNALDVQAATGLLAVLVLLVVMNWFFHRMYWTGWISLHNKRKRELLESSRDKMNSGGRVVLGMILLGFTSFYREGVEVVLFLQSYRLKLGGAPVLYGVLDRAVADRHCRDSDLPCAPEVALPANARSYRRAAWSCTSRDGRRAGPGDAVRPLAARYGDPFACWEDSIMDGAVVFGVSDGRNSGGTGNRRSGCSRFVHRCSQVIQQHEHGVP